VIAGFSLQRSSRAKGIWNLTKLFALCVVVCGFAGCDWFQRDVHVYLEDPFPKKLSTWHLFKESRNGLEPNSRVAPYDLNTPLFSDYASKYRFVWMPPGTSAQYRDDAAFDFPVGTILSKSFAFPSDDHHFGAERIVETRLLVRTANRWVALPYIWNEDQTDAELRLVPDPVPIHYKDAAGNAHDFTYQIPNANECSQCHDNNKTLLPIGPKARNLNKDFQYPDGKANQLARWTAAGYLKGAPAPEAAPRLAQWNDPSTGTLAERAAAYLDNNCAHCHQPGGTAGYTGVDFRVGHFDPSHAGFCKHPNSAGNMRDLQYDVVPGDPEQSILIYRMASTAPKVMMPQIGRDVVHTEGLALLRQWIGAMPAQACSVADAASRRKP
jgi:uncharacterized repeat protein (TIGR03806 family)